MSKNIAIIPSRVTKGEELVVVPRSSYKKFLAWEQETEDALAKVSRGRKAHREGKTLVVNSPKDLLSQAKRNARN